MGGPAKKGGGLGGEGCDVVVMLMFTGTRVIISTRDCGAERGGVTCCRASSTPGSRGSSSSRRCTSRREYPHPPCYPLPPPFPIHLPRSPPTNTQTPSLAGSDTVATAIRMTLLCLLTTPKAYLKLQSELDAAAAAGKLSSPPRDAEARTLPYLQAVVREALRRYPPATGLMTKVVPEGGDTVMGKWLPGGTELAVNIVGIMGQRDVFGEDVGVFRPERWLEGEGEADEARLRRMVSTVDMVFGGGKNTCPGRTIALIEINKVIPEVSPCFSTSFPQFRLVFLPLSPLPLSSYPRCSTPRRSLHFIPERACPPELGRDHCAGRVLKRQIAPPPLRHGHRKTREANGPLPRHLLGH